MKRIYRLCTWLLLLGCSLIPSIVDAAQYPLAITTTDTALVATMTGAPTSNDQYRLEILRAPFSAVASQNTDNTVNFGTMSDRVQRSTNGTVTWNLSGLNPTGTYYIRVFVLRAVDSLPDEAVTAVHILRNGTVVDDPIVSVWPLTGDLMPGRDNQYIFKGTLDPAKNTDFIQNNYTAVLYLSGIPFSSTTDTSPGDGRTYVAYKDPQADVPTKGINTDGTYYFHSVSITPSQRYYFKQVLTRNTTKTKVETGTFNSKDGFVASGSQKEQEINDGKTYYLLAPWPGLSALMDPDLCLAQKNAKKIPQDAICDVNGFLDFAFKLMIGLTAVVLVLRLMYEGYQYVVTDIPYLMAKAKGGFFTALLGLLLALSAYLILNTINPKLVNNTINIDSVEVGVQNFIISGALSPTLDGKPVKINFNTQAYPAAKRASEKTGVSIGLILAIFDQETSSGAGSTGKCVANTPDANMFPEDQVAIVAILNELGRPLSTTPVSCALKKRGGGYNGHGGAIGYVQVLPTTWNRYKTQAKTNLSKTTPLDPWNIDDALMFVGVFMKENGGVADPYRGACRYFGQCIFGGVDYAGQVINKKIEFEKQITKLIQEGKIQ